MSSLNRLNFDCGSCSEGAPSKRIEANCKIMRLSVDSEGQAMVESALVLPILITIFVAIFGLGATYFNIQTLQNAAVQGIEAVQVGSSYVTDPCAAMATATTNAANTLNPAKITYKLTINQASTLVTTSTSSTYSGTGSSFSCSGAPTMITNTNITAVVSYPIVPMVNASTIQYPVTLTYITQ